MIWIPTRTTDGTELPAYHSDGAAAMDLRARLDKPRILWPLIPARIPTGVAMAIPAGYFGLILGRSGLASRGLDMLGGVIDSDYRGEMHAIVVLLRLWPMILRPGDRVGQLLILPVERARLSRDLPMATTARGEAGFGSTGTR